MENLVINIIFFVSMYPIVFLMWYISRNALKPARGMLFGIHISEQWISKSEADAFEREAKRKQNHILLPLSVIPFSALFVPYFSISITIWMIWLLAAIVLLILPYVNGNRNLLALKRLRKSILQAQSGESEYPCNLSTPTPEPPQIRCIKWYDFAGPLILNILLGISTLFLFWRDRMTVLGVSILIFVLCTPLFFACALLTDRARTGKISTCEKSNEAYALEKKQIWRRFWIICAWVNTALTGIFAVIMYLQTFSDTAPTEAVLWFSIVYSLLLICIAGAACVSLQKLERKYLEKSDAAYDENEEAWIGGIIYYNPSDKHTMAANRFGTGYSMNIATFWGKCITALAGIGLLVIPVTCIWCILEEFTPISLTVSESTLTATHLRIDYQIDAKDIQNIRLIEELPTNRRTSGTGMDNLQKGNFRNADEGKVKVFLNPQNNIFLRIEAYNEIYYLSGYDDAQTKSVYEKMRVP